MLPHWRVIHRPLPDRLIGYIHAPSRIIVIESGLDQAERRSTLAHELEHVRAGHHECQTARVERAVCDRAARALIPLGHLVDGLLWTRDRHELASDLWVDLDTLACRLDNLTQNEHADIARRLSDLEPLVHRSTA